MPLVTRESIKESGWPFVIAEIRSGKEETIKWVDKDSGKSSEFDRRVMMGEIGKDADPIKLMFREDLPDFKKGDKAMFQLSSFKYVSGIIEAYVKAWAV